MKKIKWSGILTMGISLMISIVSGFCTVVGMGKVFASAALVTMGIATVIEIGRVILLYDLHHYWDKMKITQKIPGVLMLMIAMTLSAMGVYGFFANAHSQRTQEIVPIEMEIKQKQTEIQILNDAIIVNNEQLKQFDNKAFDRYTELGYVTKAVNLQKEQRKITDNLYEDSRQKQKEITKLNQEILELELSAEQKAPTLAHLKYYAKLFNVDDEMAVIIFIVMIMLVFDTLAMYLMITSDWILKEEQIEIKEEKENESVVDIKIETKNNEVIEQIKEEIKQKVGELYDCINENNNVLKKYTDKIDNVTNIVEKNSDKEIDMSPVLEQIDNIKLSLNNKDLFNKLSEIEKKLNYNSTNNIEKEDVNIVLLNKLITSIDYDENVINSKDFINMVKSEPNLKDKLIETYSKVPSILEKLNKI